MSQAGGETQSLDGVEPAKAGTNLDKPLNYDKLIKLFTHPDTVSAWFFWDWAFMVPTHLCRGTPSAVQPP